MRGSREKWLSRKAKTNVETCAKLNNNAAVSIYVWRHENDQTQNLKPKHLF